MTDPSSSLFRSPILPVTALCLSLVVLTQVISTYTAAYIAAPHEISSFLDIVDSSIQENESYDSNVDKVQRLEDKLRLTRLLREIQESGNDLRQELSRLLMAEGSTTLRPGPRVFWALHKPHLEDRVRRLDMLRTRFLVVYMGIVASSVGDRVKYIEKAATQKEVEKAHHHHQPQTPLAKVLTDSIRQRPQLRKVATSSSQATPSTLSGPASAPPRSTGNHHPRFDTTPHRMGWMGVVQELQHSPLMHRRHASVEMSMRSPPSLSPLGSPLSLAPLMDNERFHEGIESIPEDKI
ncbi:uncharacterized protein GGS25DRAFT_523980 [Hypoxylon fragiforme]|uniref:uncharacterized protein n=1 Tax=Hypoxylon fragiforme TaxID=63214 RepID=UPI0020C71E65|nr:uncharacterized protein GGS25DRAFT_523980 [Hypoxylon fragiforme]KAI2606316.1 hypothetical protein GGS25DRAFT_523980 [Hypoxylon fragiforme]